MYVGRGGAGGDAKGRRGDVRTSTFPSLAHLTST